MKHFLFSLIAINSLLYYIKSTNSDNVYIEDNVRFAGYFLQYGKFFESFLMILDLYHFNTILFSNMNKDIANEVNLNKTTTSTKSQDIIFKSNIELNGVIINDFPFIIKEDNDSDIDENDINGIIGLKMNSDGSNYFMDILKEKGFINKRIIFLTFTLFTRIDFLFDLSKKNINEYHYCDPIKITKGNQWNCAMSHILIGDDNEDNLIILPKDTSSIFTPRNLYTEIPYEYLTLFEEKLLMNREECSHKQVDDSTIIVCNCTKEKMPLKNITFIINGIGIKMNNDYIYQNYDSNRIMLMLSFVNSTIKHQWNFGNLFFQYNSIALDYDEGLIGFRYLYNDYYKDYSYKNYSKIYKEWKNGLSNQEEEYTRIVHIAFNTFIISICAIALLIIVIIVRRYNKMSKARNLIV